MTAPPKAASILMSMPADRIEAVLTAMEPADLGRILAAAKPDRAASALCSLDPERIALIFMAIAVQPAARLLMAMPEELVSRVLVLMPAERTEQLVAVVRPAPAAPSHAPAAPSHALPASPTGGHALPVAPGGGHALPASPSGSRLGDPSYATRPSEPTPVGPGRQTVAGPQSPPPAVLVPQPVRIEDHDWSAYESGVVQALGSTAAQIVPAGEDLRHCVLVKAFGWLIAVTIQYRDFSTITLPDLYAAEEAASRAMANAALTVTNVALSRDVLRYNDHAAANGRPVAAVTWTDARDNGRLQRAVVRLVR